MNEFKDYVQAKKDEFSLINDYNTKVVSFGFAAFFALATYVKSSAPKQLFIVAILLMSVSVALFVAFELLRAFFINRDAGSVSRALEKLPDDSPLRQVNDAQLINFVRLQKWNPYFFLPSLVCGVLGVVGLFTCYILALIS